MNKNILIWIFAIIILGSAVFYFTRKPSAPNQNNAPVLNETSTEVNSNMPIIGNDEKEIIVEDEDKTEDKIVNTIKEFTVTGTNYKFEPNIMTVNKGDTVKITFKDIGGFHDFKIDEFNVATKKLNTGNEQTVSFIADKTGSFEYYCSIGSHRSMGMKGILVVK